MKKILSRSKLVMMVCAFALLFSGNTAVGDKQDIVYLPALLGIRESRNTLPLQSSFFQAGIVSTGSGYYGSLEVVFPESFSETPIVIGSLTASMGDVTFHTYADSPDRLRIVWDSDVEEKNVVFSWLAIGPE